MPGLIAAGFSGLLLVVSFPRPALYALSFFALVPLLHTTRAQGARRAFAFGWLAGAVFYAVAWRWILPTISRFEEVSLQQATPYFALFVAYHAVQIGLFAAGATRTRAVAPRLAPVGIAGLWVVIEWSFPRVIPWYLGDALAPAPLLRQIADLGGAYLLSFLIVVVNALIAAALESTAPRVLRAGFATAAIATLANTALYGWSRLPQLEPSSRTDSASTLLRVAVVQGTVPSGRKDVDAANETAFGIYEELTSAAARGAGRRAPAFDLVIWPETVLRLYLPYRNDYLVRLSTVAGAIGSPLLIGALDFDRQSQRELNSAYLLSPLDPSDQPIALQVYHKRRLLPFGESVPFELPWRTTGDFIAGDAAAPVLLRLPSGASIVEVAPSICFEAIFAGAFNEAVASGASLLVNITDDGWFGNTDEPYQHLNATVLRAVETRRWLIRASNSGISGFISPSGEVVAATELNGRGILVHTVETSALVTPLVRYGNWPVGISVVVLALLAALPRKAKISRV